MADFTGRPIGQMDTQRDERLTTQLVAQRFGAHSLSTHTEDRNVPPCATAAITRCRVQSILAILALAQQPVKGASLAPAAPCRRIVATMLDGAPTRRTPCRSATCCEPRASIRSWPNAVKAAGACAVRL